MGIAGRAVRSSDPIRTRHEQRKASPLPAPETSFGGDARSDLPDRLRGVVSLRFARKPSIAGILPRYISLTFKFGHHSRLVQPKHMRDGCSETWVTHSDVALASRGGSVRWRSPIGIGLGIGVARSEPHEMQEPTRQAPRSNSGAPASRRHSARQAWAVRRAAEAHRPGAPPKRICAWPNPRTAANLATAIAAGDRAAAARRSASAGAIGRAARARDRAPETGEPCRS